jgi:hypothetical protein
MADQIPFAVGLLIGVLAGFRAGLKTIPWIMRLVGMNKKRLV